MIRGLFNSMRRQPEPSTTKEDVPKTADATHTAEEEKNDTEMLEEEANMSERKNEEELKQLIQQMRDWIKTQPHLPKDIGDYLLIRFLHSCYYDLEKAKAAAELFFSIRASSQDLFLNRDPQSPPVKKALSILKVAQINISDNRNLWIWQLNDPGLDNYDYLHDAKVFMLCSDMHLLQEPRLEDSDICIMDVKDISLKILTKLNMSIARRLSKYQEDAMPIRLKQIHIVNAPSFIDKIFGVMKVMLKPEITELIHFHTPNSQTLHDYLSKDDLPADYGGSLESLDHYMKKSMQDIMEYRDRLTSSLWRNTEKDKKSKNNKKDECVVEHTSFRSLAID